MSKKLRLNENDFFSSLLLTVHFYTHFVAQSIVYKECNGKRSRIDNQDFSAKTRQVPNYLAAACHPKKEEKTCKMAFSGKWNNVLEEFSKAIKKPKIAWKQIRGKY